MSNEPTVVLAQLVKQMREQMPAYLELEEIQAKLKWKKYVELKKNGFTDQQALELCR